MSTTSPPLGYGTINTYNSAGQWVATIVANERRTSDEYDSVGRMWRTQVPRLSIITYDDTGQTKLIRWVKSGCLSTTAWDD